MSAMVLADVMDELAARVAAYEGAEDWPFALRSYGWPNPTVSAPAFVVGYPPVITLDAAMGRGADRAQFPCWAICGLPSERTARDRLSSFLQALKTALDGPSEVWASARAQDITVEVIANEDGTEFLAARFTVDVVT